MGRDAFLRQKSFVYRTDSRIPSPTRTSHLILRLNFLYTASDRRFRWAR